VLLSMTIKNVVLIDQLTVTFNDGFCALTGETGAGKSILLDSLGLALGGRSESGLVRHGTEQAQVSAVFHVPLSHPVHALLSEQGIDSEETLILRRIVKADGGSRAFLNDQPVSAGLLRQTGELLVEIHGQFETQGLLDPKSHRALLDDYAGIKTKDILQRWQDWRTAQQDLDTAQQTMEKARAEENYLQQALEDLDGLSLKEGEEDTLAALRERLMKRDQTIQSLNLVYETLTEVETMIGTAGRHLEKIGDDGQELLAGLDRSHAEMQEVISGIRNFSSELEENEYSLEDIDERLFTLRGQARKHGCTVDGLFRKREELARQLGMIEAQDDLLATLTKNVESTRATYIKIAQDTSEKRQKAARKLDSLVAKELPPLKLEKAQFITQLEKMEEKDWGGHGMDSVRFLVSTNPGSAPGSLHKIASGGEMARFMLALKVVLAEIGTAGSLVFDEVDSGIGGATASAVGERLARLAQSKQILVVTHAPQVAACAAHHWIVLKDGTKNITTRVIALEKPEDRREEIARMLAGAEISPAARAAADQLLETGT